MNDKGEKVGRLAMRQEGGYWVAYYALEYTMKDALILGQIRMNLIVGNKNRKQEFMDMMRDCVSELIENTVGVRPNWGGPESAPEHERAGNS